MPNTTLGNVLSEGLKVIGEPEVSSLDSSNILQLHLIEEVNNCVAEIMEMGEFDWTLKHTTLTTTDDVTTGSVAATASSLTITSVDSDGDDAQNFASVTASMWFRRTGDQTSYGIASVDSTSDPHTLTLDTAYVGATTTASGYRCFQDTYALSTSDLDEIKIVGFGEGSAVLPTLSGLTSDNRITLTSLEQIYRQAGGDLHADTGGRPRLMAQIGVDSSDNPQYVLWPFPTDDYLIDLWYTIRFTDASAYATVLWGNDAPPIAYTAVAHRVKAAACIWGMDWTQQQYWEQRYREATALLKRRENTLDQERSMGVETYRRHYTHPYPVRSGVLFDTKSARR